MTHKSFLQAAFDVPINEIKANFASVRDFGTDISFYIGEFKFVLDYVSFHCKSNLEDRDFKAQAVNMTFHINSGETEYYSHINFNIDGVTNSINEILEGFKNLNSLVDFHFRPLGLDYVRINKGKMNPLNIRMNNNAIIIDKSMYHPSTDSYFKVHEVTKEEVEMFFKLDNVTYLDKMPKQAVHQKNMVYMGEIFDKDQARYRRGGYISQPHLTKKFGIAVEIPYKLRDSEYGDVIANLIAHEFIKSDKWVFDGSNNDPEKIIEIVYKRFREIYSDIQKNSEIIQ